MPIKYPPIIEPPPAWTDYKQPDGAVLLVVFTLNSEPTLQMSQQKSRIGWSGNIFPIFCWACANCSLSLMFLTNRSGVQRSLLIHVVFVDALLHYFVCNKWLFWLLILPLASIRQTFSLDMFSFVSSFSVDYRGGSVGKSQYIHSFWNTQTSLSGINNHSTFRIT